jgi:hypothetical protein
MGVDDVLTNAAPFAAAFVFEGISENAARF